MYCGLDFGTSNSLCTVENEDEEDGVRYIAFDEKHSSVPSAVFYPDGKLINPLFGRDALDCYLDGNEGRLLRSFKRLLGTKYFPSGTMLTSRNKLKFQDLFVSFIRHVKDAAEKQVGQEIEEVVFGRPVKFSSLETAHKSGENDLVKVASSIGFKHVEFQFEPIASAFTHERRLRNEKLAIVADIGGGTSDFSVLRLGPERKNAVDRSDDILANSGIAIGGTDFDSLISLRQVMPAFGYLTKYGMKELNVPNTPYIVASDWNKIAVELYLRRTYLVIKNVMTEAKEPHKLERFLTLMDDHKGHHILKLVEEAKIELSENATTYISPDFIEENLQIPIDRATFDLSLASKITSLQHTIQEALVDAHLKPASIELIIMTGGASAVPIIQNTFLDMFPNAELSAENKMGSVCEGLLYDARRKFGRKKE